MLEGVRRGLGSIALPLLGVAALASLSCSALSKGALVNVYWIDSGWQVCKVAK